MCREEDAIAISRAVRAQKGAHTITGYLTTARQRQHLAYTDVGDYAGHRVGSKWVFQQVVITS